jgi:cytochrome P450
MARGIADLPVLPWSDEAVYNGGFPALQAAWATEYGPIFKQALTRGPHAGYEFVYMVGPEANRFVLHTHRDHFSHELGWTPVIGEQFGRGLLNMDDPDHARHRKMWNPAFTSTFMESYLPVIQQVIAERSDTWAQRGEVDLYHEARQITFDAAARALAGFEPGAEVDRLRELFAFMLHGFDPDRQTWDQFQQGWYGARNELVAALIRMIAARRATLVGSARDVLGLIVHAKDEHGAALSDEQVLAHLNILLVAGHETTTTLGAWVLYLLATEGEHRQRAERELDALAPDRAAQISVEAIRSMRVLDNFIRETGRLYSPVMNVPRGIVKDFEFAGYTIPAGTQMRLALGATHRLPSVWTNPDTFDPDRLAPPREEDKKQPYSLVTFGGGPRICIGINFANIEVKALAAHVLRHYRLEPVPGQQPRHTGYWTAELPDGVRVRVYDREQTREQGTGDGG